MNISKRRKIAFIIQIVMVVFEMVALGLCMNDGGARNFKYFTVLSNVSTMLVSLIYILLYLKMNGQQKELPRWLRLLRYMATNCLALTFIIVVTVLVPMGAKDGLADDLLYKGPQSFHHILCPFLSVFSFCLFEEGELKVKWDIVIAIIPTILYAIIFTFLNLIKVLTGPYAFLEVYNQPVYLSIIWFILINGISYGLAWLILLGTRLKWFKSDQEAKTEEIRNEEENNGHDINDS